MLHGEFRVCNVARQVALCNVSIPTCNLAFSRQVRGQVSENLHLFNQRSHFSILSHLHQDIKFYVKFNFGQQTCRFIKKKINKLFPCHQGCTYLFIIIKQLQDGYLGQGKSILGQQKFIRNAPSQGLCFSNQTGSNSNI